MKDTIFFVESEQKLREALTQELENQGYQVLTAKNNKEAINLFLKENGNIQLVLLDWNPTENDELELLQVIQKQGRIPVISITNQENQQEISTILDNGVDDYLIKPFEMEELLARIRVAMRHHNRKVAIKDDIYRIDNLTLNTKTHQVFRDGESIQLTHREFQLLLTLFRAQGEVLSRDELLKIVWGKDFQGQANIVDVYVRLLRQKIKDTNRSNRLIKTIRGVGYSIQNN